MDFPPADKGQRQDAVDIYCGISCIERNCLLQSRTAEAKLCDVKSSRQFSHDIKIRRRNTRCCCAACLLQGCDVDACACACAIGVEMQCA